MRIAMTLILALTASSVLAQAPGTDPTKTAPPETQPVEKAPAKPDSKSPQSNPAAPAAPATPAAEPAKTEPVKRPWDGLPVIKTQELEGGLIVEDLKVGTGYEIKTADMVVAHYHGTFKSDGNMFDSSYDKGGKPIGFPLTGVIQGWQKGVPGMKIGGIRRLVVPYALAYGEGGSGPIPAKADLVFVIEMVDAVQFEDVKVGEGEEVATPALVVTAQTITGADGKVVDQNTAKNPYIWLPGENQGMDAALKGVKLGGKRKIHIPGDFNQTPPGLKVTRPSGVPITVEVEVLGLRNLPRR